MTRKQKKELRKRQSTRQLMGIDRLTEHGVAMPRGELVFFLIRPDNLSVLSPEVIRGRVRALMELLRGTDELIAIAPNEWIAAAPTSLHIRMSCGGELIMSQMLISKGLQPGADTPTVLQNYTCSPDRFWMAERLLKNGMELRRNDYLSLDVCMRNGAADAAKLLLDKGMDFGEYQAWAEKHSHASVDEQTCGEVQQHWNDILSQQQEVAEAPAQGIAFGGLMQ